MAYKASFLVLSLQMAAILSPFGRLSFTQLVFSSVSPSDLTKSLKMSCQASSPLRHHKAWLLLEMWLPAQKADNIPSFSTPPEPAHPRQKLNRLNPPLLSVSGSFEISRHLLSSSSNLLTSSYLYTTPVEANTYRLSLASRTKCWMLPSSSSRVHLGTSLQEGRKTGGERSLSSTLQVKNSPDDVLLTTVSFPTDISATSQKHLAQDVPRGLSKVTPLRM